MTRFSKCLGHRLNNPAVSHEFVITECHRHLGDVNNILSPRESVKAAVAVQTSIVDNMRILVENVDMNNREAKERSQALILKSP